MIRCDDLDFRRVLAFGNGDAQGIVAPVGGIVAVEIPAQAAGLEAHDRIDLRVEAFVASENGDRDGVAFQAIGPAGKRFFDDITKKPAPLLTRLETRTGEDTLKFRPHLAFGGPESLQCRMVRKLDHRNCVPSVLSAADPMWGSRGHANAT